MIRRTIDILVSGSALMILAPLLAGLGLVIWIRDGRPVLFRQWRAGLHAVPFQMIKFRTMCVDAEQSGGTLTYRADPRITRLGRFLRRSKLDELPQLINVLSGEMTLIGPRPEVLDWVERFTPDQRELFSAKPGLTDPVQLLFRHEHEHLKSAAEYEKLVTIKVRKQIEYLRSRTPLTDLVIAFRTVRTLFPSKPSEEELAVYALIENEASTIEE